MKKILLIWDFDGPIGQINSSYPYNYHHENLEEEINNVKWVLQILKEKKIKTCFAITGFSAEKGVYPFNFPEFINEIASQGHEIASHSWRHEWVPIFKRDQISKSLKRSKMVLERAINSENTVVGFVPPHNRPMTWLRRGAFSIGDRGVFPFFKLGDNEKLINLLKETDYRWIRVSYNSFFSKIGLVKKNLTGRIIKHKGVLVLENHYTGFDKKVLNHILSTNYNTYTVSAHPYMLSLEGKDESKENFLNFLDTLLSSNQNIEFVLPSSFIE